MDKDYKLGKLYLENIKDSIDETCAHLNEVYLKASFLVDSLQHSGVGHKTNLVCITKILSKVTEFSSLACELKEINCEHSSFNESSRTNDITDIKTEPNKFSEPSSIEKNQNESLKDVKPETVVNEDSPSESFKSVASSYAGGISTYTFMNRVDEEKSNICYRQEDYRFNDEEEANRLSEPSSIEQNEKESLNEHEAEINEASPSESSKSCASVFAELKLADSIIPTSTFMNPLDEEQPKKIEAGIATPTKIPEEFQPEDVDKVRENLKYFERRLSGDLDKKVEHSSLKSVSSESTDKVNEWLKINETLKGSVVEKFKKFKMRNADEEVRHKALTEVPDLDFIEVASNKNNDKFGSKKKSLIRKMVHSEIPPSESINYGDVCCFVHINSPQDFYIQVVNQETASNIDKLDSFSDPYQRKSPFSNKAEACEKLGHFCVGFLYEKYACYRLEVLDWKLNSKGDHVEVFSVDFGFTTVTSYKSLRSLASWMTKIPRLATKCRLYQLYPPGSTFANRLTHWEGGIIETFKGFAQAPGGGTYSDDMPIFKICWVSNVGDSVAVDMEIYPASTGNTLGGYLVEIAMAVEIADDDYGSHEELGEFLHDRNELERPDNLGELVFGYDATDEKRICRFTNSDGTCYKGKNCHLEHTKLQDFTTDKIPVFCQAFNEYIPPVFGEKVTITITYYVHSCMYYAQVIRTPVQIDGTKYDVDAEMAKLIDLMNNPKTVSKYNEPKLVPAVGEMLLTFHPGWNKWVRAKVIKTDEEYYLVNVVDFGENLRVTKKNVREMRAEFLHLPFQAIEIYLSGCRPTLKSRDGSDFEEFFQKHIFLKNFVAEFLSKHQPFKVVLTTKKGNPVHRHLCSKGFAQMDSGDTHIATVKIRDNETLGLG